jgi:hypothetical protein
MRKTFGWKRKSWSPFCLLLQIYENCYTLLLFYFLWKTCYQSTASAYIKSAGYHPNFSRPVFTSCYLWYVFGLHFTCQTPHTHTHTHTHTPWPESASELYRPSDRRLSAKLVPTIADITSLFVISLIKLSGLRHVVILFHRRRFTYHRFLFFHNPSCLIIRP